MVDSMDAAFGRLVEALLGAGVLNNTIVVFSSDNGAVPIIEFPNQGFNWPLRGAKKTLWEGAVRVPAFIWSPLLESSGRVSDQMMHIVDWLPTFYSVAGGNLSDLGEQDGFDMWKALSEGTESPREEMLLNIDPVLNTSSLRYKNHKVVLGTYHNGSFDHRFKTTGRRRPVDDLDFLTKRSRAADVLRRLYRTDDLEFPAGWRRRATVRCGECNLAKDNVKPSSPPYLFDVAADPCELNNLAPDHPEKWALAIHRADKALEENSAVCERHFDDSHKGEFDVRYSPPVQPKGGEQQPPGLSSASGIGRMPSLSFYPAEPAELPRMCGEGAAVEQNDAALRALLKKVVQLGYHCKPHASRQWVGDGWKMFLQRSTGRKFDLLFSFVGVIVVFVFLVFGYFTHAGLQPPLLTFRDAEPLKRALTGLHKGVCWE
ncbi:hypothetical protein HPB47_026349 [Ixodes persulcatus]|uniref:Uncharacterized protein n=1 Tax=Ixodes persulcatus TaxID=34615 RepID=A0AC60PYZ1_IXOPE|nr:hypothetical protein HPB47_026349 [Ixodes persulcatus]